MDFEMDIASVRETIGLSGRAMKKVDMSLEILISVITAVRDITLSQDPDRGYGGKRELFEQAQDQGRAIFKTVVGVQRLSRSRERNGNGENGDAIENLVAGIEPIADEEYPIMHEEDLRKELNRLNTIAATYESLFKLFSNDAMSIYTASSRLATDQVNQTETFPLLTSSVRQMKDSLTSNRRLILQGTTLAYAQLSVGSVVRAATDVAQLMYDTGQSKIALHVDYIPETVMINGSSFEFMQALLNVLRAKQYVLRNTRDAEVHIRYETRGPDYAAIVVRDNGPQIPHSEPSLIIELARKKASIEHWPGDISVARDYVEQYGGTFTVRNPPSLVGVEMDMTLPL
ncbi:hypothetical protein KY359_00635 [Candidatus Woesearchaeota archaeon]|nr:hypothetical protein [Candidatus Woesearchaeota archaeon]